MAWVRCGGAGALALGLAQPVATGRPGRRGVRSRGRQPRCRSKRGAGVIRRHPRAWSAGRYGYRARTTPPSSSPTRSSTFPVRAAVGRARQHTKGSYSRRRTVPVLGIGRYPQAFDLWRRFGSYRVRQGVRRRRERKTGVVGGGMSPMLPTRPALPTLRGAGWSVGASPTGSTPAAPRARCFRRGSVQAAPGGQKWSVGASPTGSTPRPPLAPRPPGSTVSFATRIRRPSRIHAIEATLLR
jgi:hypothetical protein